MPTAELKKSELSAALKLSAPANTPRPIYSKYADDDVIGPLLKEFVADLPAQLAELYAAAAQQDDRRLTNLLSHRLKGDAATYGYPELAHAAHELEQATQPSLPPLEATQLARLLAAMQIIGRRICSGVPATSG